MATVDLNVTGGTDYAAAYGQLDYYTFSGAFTAGGYLSLLLSSTAGNATFGRGRLAENAGTTATICGLTLSDRVYLGIGQQFLYSAISDATGWEQQDIGAGYVGLLSQYGQQDGVLGMASYQGMLAVYGRYSTQIWQVNADPLLFLRRQTLPNTGTLSALSVQSLGDADVLSLADFGIWSLRVRDSSLNGTVIDIGSAIAPIVQDVLVRHPTSGPASCGVVEPTTNSYWLFLYDEIHVLSYFPNARVSAWASFKPTDSGGATFTPKKFVIYNGQVYVRGTIDGTDYLLLYGGADNNTYDASKAKAKLPWLAGQGANRTPATIKQATAVDLVMEGAWTLKASMDYLTEDESLFTTLLTESEPTPIKGSFPYTAQGTHFCLIAETSDAATGGVVPKLSSLIFHFRDGAEK